MAFISREERLSNAFRKAEALYRQGYEVEEIANICRISVIDAIEITQQIYGRDKMREEKDRKERRAR